MKLRQSITLSITLEREIYKYGNETEILVFHKVNHVDMLQAHNTWGYPEK